ncbi:hypothetical protein HHA03_24990 [Halolactibacillus halophilus]|uniref:Uncharacterized protein n=1 Tax=Halolactibacillus halophilus TaxID=306540 RepID=A0ABQ0VP79_9BACI|nr:hypothetical protein HHA03_24990 [Halolactibacillus halophilus]
MEKLIDADEQRWEIEESLRIMKTELTSLPVYVRNDDRIEAHFLTCFRSIVFSKKVGQCTSEIILRPLKR